jgi:hypothetical protein
MIILILYCLLGCANELLGPIQAGLLCIGSKPRYTLYGHLQNKVCIKLALEYFLVSWKARICNPKDEASEYKVNLVLEITFSPCIGFQYKVFSFPV